MIQRLVRRFRLETLLIALMVVQAVCAAMFLGDVIDDYVERAPGGGFDFHITLELVANVGLVAAILVEGYFLRWLLRQNERAERALSAASGALHELMRAYFDSWGLTPSEAEVAQFTIKGFSIAEIAGLRGAAEGTVKSQLNAIYRKSGLAGRGQLVSLLIEDILNGSVRPDAAPGRSVQNS
ncbi:helix-turn-helix transcriptional regulator [Frigidibacter sp. SD6-1]|uniref:helix-turn-helix transcriptional regulator n=1 Tax=Frigidibacter sp. SD6-1 TaxID=3032581 RepID=UPI0024DF9498|nr:helix-turn-helix transcriptional regulator [Frigidibacter sp. SD6-1]